GRDVCHGGRRRAGVLYPSPAYAGPTRRNLMRLGLVISSVFSAFFISTMAWACEFDTDCEVGSKCVKPTGSLYGFCAGGLQPGNSNDQQPARDPLDPVGTSGKTCQFDVNWGPGHVCAKDPSSIYGVCLRNQ